MFFVKKTILCYKAYRTDIVYFIQVVLRENTELPLSKFKTAAA